MVVAMTWKKWKGQWPLNTGDIAFPLVKELATRGFTCYEKVPDFLGEIKHKLSMIATINHPNIKFPILWGISVRFFNNADMIDEASGWLNRVHLLSCAWGVRDNRMGKWSPVIEAGLRSLGIGTIQVQRLKVNPKRRSSEFYYKMHEMIEPQFHRYAHSNAMRMLEMLPACRILTPTLARDVFRKQDDVFRRAYEVMFDIVTKHNGIELYEALRTLKQRVPRNILIDAGLIEAIKLHHMPGITTATTKSGTIRFFKTGEEFDDDDGTPKNELTT